ncbi:hypothetical protein STRDD11_01658 [Streptococcus sp. DD11]|uniref:hypothetical protein n=1 Tax=Streptococcus sp. DD11 TaxID=1777879 RepID=UPI0007947CF3|nr:hypothetical protein [Streptococcus sp. DD11]KXT83150.1 hypothetical protein STRDD11_01658 [Streptococcus sp. DD11]
MAGFALGKGGVIKDSSFIYIEWAGKDSPKRNGDIKDLIEDLDEEYFLDSGTMGDSLPYLTFLQAETLFHALRDQFGDFTLAKVSLANNESGKPSIEDEPSISPFLIDHTYDNIMTKLMEASLRDPRFKDYTYDDLALYFTDKENGILRTYAESLNLSQADLPYFPMESDVQGAIKRAHPKKNRNKGVSEMGEQNLLLSKIALGLGIAGLLIGILGLVIGMMGNSKRAQLEAQTAFLYQEQQKIQKLQEKEHAADVFGRFFIPNYYSGNKEALNPFLSSGDAKYTQPEQAQIVSNLLENVKLEKDDTFTLTYVITFSTAEGVKTKRLSFGIKEDNKAEYGFLITSEPVSSIYISENNNGDESKQSEEQGDKQTETSSGSEENKQSESSQAPS